MTMRFPIIVSRAFGLALMLSTAGCQAPDNSRPADCPPVVCPADAGAAEQNAKPDEPVPDGERVPARPNIVLFSIDTLRADHLGVYGYDRPTSPQIDAFAEGAVLFERAISQAPSTAPAHMSIFTAVTPAVHRVVNLSNDHPAARPDPRLPNLVEGLRAQGYLTAGFHGGGNTEAMLGLDRGYYLYTQDLVSYNWIGAYRNPRDLSAVERWLDISRDRHRPFFLFLHHYVCHAPYISAPDELRERFLEGRAVVGLPRGVSDDQRRRFVERIDAVGTSRAKLINIQRVFGSRLRSFWKGVNLGLPDHNAHIQALYDSGVIYSDYLFEEIRRILERHGVLDETIVVLTSDHGEEFFEHGGREHGRLFVEHLHVPLLIRFPRRAGIEPRRIETPVRTMDILPTLFDFLGLPQGQPNQGRSFLPLITGTGSYNPVIASYSVPDFAHLRVELDSTAYTDEPHLGATELLFDIGADPAEQHDAIASRKSKRDAARAVVEELRGKDRLFLERLSRETPGKGELDPRLLEQLKELGYVDE